MIALSHYRTQQHQSNKFGWTFLALCSVLSMLIIDSQQKFVSANVISTSATEAHQHQQQQKMVRKSAGGWVQTYKEPKNDETAEDGQGDRAVAGDEPREAERDQAEQQQQEELSCTIKVHKVEKYSGKCVRLRGGPAACQTDTYLDPTSEDCMFLA